MLETGAHVETPPIPEPALAEPVVLAEEPELLSGTEARAEQELPPEPEPVAAGLEAAPALKIAPLISAPQTASPEALSSQSLPSQGLPSEGPAPDLAVPPESSSAAATPVETTAAMPAVEPVDPTPTAPSPQGTPSLRDLAATEQRDELEVNVAAAVTAVRTAVRTSDAPVAPEAGASVAPEAGASAAPGVDSPSTASLTIKERMVRASRARRKQRPDLVTESIDPVLPDWYEPDVDEPNGTTGSKGKSADRRQ